MVTDMFGSKVRSDAVAESAEPGINPKPVPAAPWWRCARVDSQNNASKSKGWSAPPRQQTSPVKAVIIAGLPGPPRRVGANPPPPHAHHNGRHDQERRGNRIHAHRR